MMLWLIAAASLLGLIGLVLLYWRALALTFPEKLSTDEVFLLSTEDLWKIRVCRYRRGRTNGQPVLLVHGANTNQHSFTSPKGANLVEYLVERGYDCWTVDLRGSRSSEAPFERHRNQITTDDFLNYDIPAAIRFIQQETGYAKIHYCGQSLGGMLLYAYVLKFGGDAIASGVTLGSPIGFDGARIPRAPFLAALIRFSPVLAGEVARGLIPFALLTRKSPLPFPMNTRNIARGLSTAHFYNMLEDPLPGVLRDLLRWYRTPGWKMDRGALDVQGGLPTIDIPLFTVFAPLDPFVPLNRAQAFFDDLASTDKRILIASKELGCKRDYNHCDLAFGMEGPREIFGPIARWFETHTSREQIAIIEPSKSSGYQAPLRPSERADILSGGSFARIAAEPVPTAEVEVPAPPVLPLKEEAHEAPAVSDLPDEAVLEIEPVAEVVAEAPVAKAPKKKAAAKKPAAKATAKKAPAKKAAAKAPAKKAPAKKPAAKAPAKKAPAKKAPAKKPATPMVVEDDTANKKPRAPIGARGAAGKSPDLASVSAAITALRPGPASAAATPPAKIKVKQARDHTPPPGKDEPVETPKSVLKALSKASDALGAFKKPESAE